MRQTIVIGAIALLSCSDDGTANQETAGSTGLASSSDTQDASGTAGTSGSSQGTTAAVTDGMTSSATTTDAPTTGGTDTDGPADPEGYEGFGAMTLGHESCPDTPDEVHVTTLEDGGAGSLREALSDGCRLVVFDVGGSIVLQSDLNIPYSYITIDGASAPDPGITIVQPDEIGTTIEASGSIGPISDIIIHHLRMDGMALSHLNAGDIWGMDGEANPVSNIIIDHVTGVAATDGVFDIWENVSNVTISWCLIMDTVTALHLSTGDVNSTREQVSFHHNVFARNNERQVRLRHATTQIDFTNNVVYGWGWQEGGGAGLHVAYDDGETNPSLNVVANAFVHVASTNGDPDEAIIIESGTDIGTLYFEDNLVPAGEGDNVSNGDAFDVPAWAAVTRYATDELGTSVVPVVGTQFPTAEESALLAEISGAL